jgi:heme-degrading monooxygenase HmoA
MHMVIRTYTGHGAKELFDVLKERAADVESTMRTVKGFVSYTLARSADGGVAVTVCQDFAGAMESLEKAKEWVAKNAAHTGVGPPKASDGVVIVHASAG